LLGTWEKGNAEALQLILVSIEDEITDTYSDLMVASEMWNAIQSQFKGTGIKPVVSLLLKLRNREKTPEWDIESQIQEIKQICGNLASEDLLAAALIASLPPAWNTIQSSLIKRHSLTLRETIESICSYERKGKYREKPHVTQNRKRKKPQPGSRERGGHRPRCSNCRKWGHIIEECWAEGGEMEGADPEERSPEEGAATAATATSTGAYFEIDPNTPSHMTSDRSFFITYRKFDQPKCVRAANQKFVKAIGIGNIKIKPLTSETSHPVILTQVLHVPNITQNLLSTHQFSSVGLTTIFHTKTADIQDSKTGKLIARAESDGSQYRLRVETPNLEGAEPSQGKVLGRVSSGIHGPIHHATREGHRYIVTFTDDHSRYTNIGFAGKVEDIPKLFKRWRVHAEKETGRKLEVFRTDRGGAYNSEEFNRILAEAGIKHELIEAVTPLEDDAAELAGHSLNGRARSMLDKAREALRVKELPRNLWDFAIRHAIWTKNRVLAGAREGGKTPYEVYLGKEPSLVLQRPFGCAAYMHTPEKSRGKTRMRSVKGVYVGFDEKASTWMLYDQEKRQIIESREVVFTEIGKSERKWGDVDDRKRGIWNGAAEIDSKGVVERQNGDLGGEKGAKCGKKNTTSAPKITKSTKTRPSDLQNLSKLTPSARAKQPVTTRPIPRRQNRSNSSDSSDSSDEGPKTKLGESGPEDQPNPLKSTRKVSAKQPATTESIHRQPNRENRAYSSNSSDEGPETRKLGENDPEGHSNAANSTREASMTQPMTTESTHRRLNRENRSKSSNNSDKSREMNLSADSPSDQPEVLKPRLRAHTKGPTAIDLAQCRYIRRKPRKSSSGSDEDPGTDSSPKRARYSPKEVETTTSKGEIETDSSVGDTDDDDEPLFTPLTATDSDDTESSNSELLRDCDEAMRQWDAPDWRQSIIEEYEGDSGDEAESRTSRDGENGQKDDASRGESKANEDAKTNDAPKPNPRDHHDLPPSPKPDHNPSPPSPKSSRSLGSTATTLDPWGSACMNKAALPIYPDRVPGMESTPYSKQKNAKTKDLRENDHSVGGESRDEEIKMNRSVIDDKPALISTEAPRSHQEATKQSNRVEALIAKYENFKRCKVIKIDEPIDA